MQQAVTQCCYYNRKAENHLLVVIGCHVRVNAFRLVG